MLPFNTNPFNYFVIYYFFINFNSKEEESMFKVVIFVYSDLVSCKSSTV